MGRGFSETQADYETRLLLTQTLTMAMIKELTPNAVHWVQSQQLLDAGTFTQVAKQGFSLPLYCGPFLFGGEQMPDGSVKAGVRALGSQTLLGKMVVFSPHVQSWAESYAQILAFIAHCRSIGRILGDGETFAAEGADAPVIRVTHKNDVPRLPDGYVELSVDGRTSADISATTVMRADAKDLRAAMSGARNELAPEGSPRRGLLGRLFGSK